MNFLGIFKGLFGQGHGIEGCKREAAAGKAEAQFHLGCFYENGKFGLPKDYVESARWYRKAAEQNHAGAQLYLGVYLAEGTGVEVDLVEALKWVLLAKRGSALDQSAASEVQKRLEEVMTEDQITRSRFEVELFSSMHDY